MVGGEWQEGRTLYRREKAMVWEETEREWDGGRGRGKKGGEAHFHTLSCLPWWFEVGGEVRGRCGVLGDLPKSEVEGKGGEGERTRYLLWR